MFSKCMKSVIKMQLVDFLEINNLMHNAQYGFRAERSTVTNLLSDDKYLAE